MYRSMSVALLIGTIGLTGPVAAQSFDDPIARCRSAGDDKARIACLESALRVIPPVSPGGLPSATATTPTPQGTVPSEPGPILPTTSPATSVPAPPAPAISVPRQTAATGLGAEQIVRKQERKRPNKEKSREKIESPIQSFARNSLGKWVFVLKNGQIWRQLQGDPTNPVLREESNYTASIRRGTISGYRMNIREVRSTLVVERLR